MFSISKDLEQYRRHATVVTENVLEIPQGPRISTAKKLNSLGTSLLSTISVVAKDVSVAPPPESKTITEKVSVEFPLPEKEKAFYITLAAKIVSAQRAICTHPTYQRTVPLSLKEFCAICNARDRMVLNKQIPEADMLTRLYLQDETAGCLYYGRDRDYTQIT